MRLDRIFDVFSRRPSETPSDPKPLTDTFRQRVLMLCNDTFEDLDQRTSSGDYRREFWEAIYKRLLYLLGKPRLLEHPHISSPMEEIYAFLVECGDEHFLDFIEYVIQVDCYWRVCPDENQLVTDVNQLFLLDDLPFALTPFVRERRTELFHGQEQEVHALVSYPRIIFRDREIPYSSAIQPTIALLSEKAFSSANAEFIGALQDYRKGDYGDCLTKCGSAFESTLKIICARNSWPFQEHDTASTLLQTVIGKSGLEPFFEQPLLIVATLRNRLGTAHGSGAQQRVIAPAKARFAINATASAILLLAEQCV